MTIAARSYLVPRFFAAARPARRRTYREFAEQEYILPSGPRGGFRFTVEFMPFVGFVFDEYDRGVYSEFFLSGPAQSAKSTIGCIIPAMYHLFEMEEDVILGAPVAEMAQAFYEERILPSIEASRYRELLPRKGSGSRGGRVKNSIRFEHGPRLRFMGAGGGDSQISSYTARVVIMTEIDKMDTPGRFSREADPISKLKARAQSYGSSRRIYGECTMSIKSGRIYQEVCVFGTDSQVYLPCRHCGEYVLPERKSFVGWQEAPNVLEAQARAALLCPACGKAWTEKDRGLAIRRPRMAARGQVLRKDGSVEGPLPPTRTFGFRWNAIASPLLSLADIAEREWKAEQSVDESLKKDILQHVWAEPYEGEIKDLTRPDVNTVLAKIVGHARGVVPPETVKLTLGIDVGSYVIFWSLWAWKSDAQGHLVDFGGIDVPLQGGVKNPTAVLAALRTFRQNIIGPGWGGRRPDRVLIDSGYEQAVVYEFVLESEQPRYLACKGFGTSSRHGGWHGPAAAEPSQTRQVGNEWFATLQPTGIRLVNFHSDHWKAQIHDGFWAAQGAPGSLTILRGEKTDSQLRIFARMIVAEQREIKAIGEKEARVVWAVKSRTNHYLDTSAMARLAAEIEGVRLAKAKTDPPKSSEQPPPAEGGRRIRTSY